MALFKSKKQADVHKAPDEYVIDDEHVVVFNSSGLVPVVIQDDWTCEVLKLGYLDRLALEMSTNSKKVYIFRRSLRRLEAFGEQQGLEYKISAIKLSHNRRSLLFKVTPMESENSEMDSTPRPNMTDVRTDFLYAIYPKKSRI